MPIRRLDQYGRSRVSIRTTPRELGACTNASPPSAMPTCDAPGAVVVKKSRSPGCCSPGVTAVPTRNCSRVSRGSAVPTCANTYWVNPEQSNPRTSDPPLRYGTPRSSNAARTRTPAAPPADGGAVTGFTPADAVPPGPDACGGRGIGNGLGALRVDAHAPQMTERAIAPHNAIALCKRSGI